MTKTDYKTKDQAWDVDDKLDYRDIAATVEVHVGGWLLQRWKFLQKGIVL
jgi:hypothetical protein